MANHNLPTLTSTYANFVQEMDARMDDISIGFDPALTTVTNQATNTIRWVSASNKWEKWSGTTWNDLAATYAISISGSAGTANTLSTARAINGVNFNGSAAININLVNALTVNASGTGAASGSTFNGNSATTISYNSVGAPSTTGTNASGTWGINITGNAATATSATSATEVTNGVYTVGDQSIAGNKTFTNQVNFKSTSETVHALGSGTVLDPLNGTIQTRTITANTTFTETLQSGQSIVLMLTNGNLFTVTWPTITWVRLVGNITPTLSSITAIVLWKTGTTLYGAPIG
jgi:hypothetical protein